MVPGARDTFRGPYNRNIIIILLHKNEFILDYLHLSMNIVMKHTFLYFLGRKGTTRAKVLRVHISHHVVLSTGPLQPHGPELM